MYMPLTHSRHCPHNICIILLSIGVWWVDGLKRTRFARVKKKIQRNEIRRTRFYQIYNDVRRPNRLKYRFYAVSVVLSVAPHNIHIIYLKHT